MTTININGVKTYSKDILNIRSVSFDYLGHKVYSAEKIQRMFGVFVSQPVEGESGLVSWKELSWSAQTFTGTDVFVYIKSSTLLGLDSASWVGPYLNSANDISDLKGKYLQFMVVLVNYGTTNKNYQNIDVAATPIFRSIELSYYSSSSAAKFYSTAFELGFVPKHILLTYNGDITSDAIVRFAVSGSDTILNSDYQYIDPNKIEELSELSLLSTKIKLMIEMIGSSSIPITIHEVALMFSGDQQLVLNDMSSSSLSESSSSSSTP